MKMKVIQMIHLLIRSKVLKKVKFLVIKEKVQIYNLKENIKEKVQI